MIIHHLNRRQSADFGRFIMGAVQMDARRALKAARKPGSSIMPERVRALAAALAEIEATIARLPPPRL
jgi:hypothetical protein